MGSVHAEVRTIGVEETPIHRPPAAVHRPTPTTSYTAHHLALSVRKLQAARTVKVGSYTKQDPTHCWHTTDATSPSRAPYSDVAARAPRAASLRLLSARSALPRGTLLPASHAGIPPFVGTRLAVRVYLACLSSKVETHDCLSASSTLPLFAITLERMHEMERSF